MQSNDDDGSQADAIAAVRAGRRDAFRVLVEAHQGRVYRICLHLLREPARAEDLAQDTFVTAFRKLDQFDANKGSFAAWLVTIARRLCINAMKKWTPLSMAEPPEATAPQRNSPDHSAARIDAFRALDRALAELTEDQRRAFVLAEIEELPYNEIAIIEGIASGTVKSRVSRAKLALQGLLRPTYEELKDSQR